MLKRAQYDYVNLKIDFDRFVRQTQEKNATIATEYLIDVVKKFLPFFEDIRKSLENIPPEQLENHLAKGIQIVYDNFIKTLESLHIYPIQSLGELPDSLYHEPISILPTQDETMK
jgi:molecular chaperone GrpE